MSVPAHGNHHTPRSGHFQAATTHPMPVPCARLPEAGPHAENATVSIAEFRDSDRGYLAWLAAHGDGYVINIGRSGRGHGRLHRAACGTITSRSPFTGPYIKICSASLAELDQWALQRTGAAVRRCGTCQPLSGASPAEVVHGSPVEPSLPGTARGSVVPGTAAASGPDWEIQGPGGGLAEVWLWARHYIPFDRLSAVQREAREALRLAVRAMTAGTGEILDASYAGFKPANMDAENLVLYNIDAAASGCFQPGVRHGVRFELASGPRRVPPSGQRFTCSYRYRLISPAGEISYWRSARQLAAFARASLGRFPASRRLEQAWLAIHRAEAEVADGKTAAGAPFAVFLTLGCPRANTMVASPELVKALIDGTVAAFQAPGDLADFGEISVRIAAATSEPSSVIRGILADGQRAVLGTTGSLVRLRGTGVQWNPADHLCVAGQVLIAETTGDTWTLSGDIQAVEPRH